MVVNVKKIPQKIKNKKFVEYRKNHYRKRKNAKL